MDLDDPKLSIPTDVDPDQSCSQCGSQDIQLAPLQREVGLNNWMYSPDTNLRRWRPPCLTGFTLYPKLLILFHML